MKEISVDILVIPAGKIPLYPSSHYGFDDAGRHYMYTKFLPAIQKVDKDIMILNPWDLTPQSEIDNVRKIKDEEIRLREWRKLNRRIYLRNKSAVKPCRIMIAVLEGLDVDPGVSWETGYRMGLDEALEIRTPIIGYRSDFRKAGENPGVKINVQVEEAIKEAGHPIQETLDEVIALLAKEIAKLK